MTLRRWNDDELAIVIYFVFRNADHEAYVKIIQYKIEKKNLKSRSNVAVRIKLDDIRKIKNLWHHQTDWNLKIVDEYLKNLHVFDFDALKNVNEKKLTLISEICIFYYSTISVIDLTIVQTSEIHRDKIEKSINRKKTWLFKIISSKDRRRSAAFELINDWMWCKTIKIYEQWS